jgi:hypothetical protein
VSFEASETGFDVLPTLLVLQRLANGLGDEHAATPAPNTLVEPLHEIAVESMCKRMATPLHTLCWPLPEERLEETLRLSRLISELRQGLPDDVRAG